MTIMRKILIRNVQLAIKAFTLLETLLVMFIVSFILLLFAGSLTKSVQMVRGELFIVRFENHYKNTQFLASATGQSQVLSANSGKLTYGSKTDYIPPEVIVEDFSIKFDEKGNNSSLKKLKIYLPNERKTILYQLEMGSGKYRKTINYQENG